MKTDDPTVDNGSTMNTQHSSPLAFGQAAFSNLNSAFQQLSLGPKWQLEHIALSRLRSAEQSSMRYLILHVDVFLLDLTSQRHAQLCLTLSSDAWQPTHPLPSAPVDESAPDITPCRDSSLRYRLRSVVAKPQAHPRATAWLHYMHLPSKHDACGQETVSQYISLQIGNWLQNSLNVTSVAGAEAALLTGAVGYFGPVEAYVLERSAQADLAVDATLLGSADDADENGGEPAVFLTLYGERFGHWLLHRRTVKVVKPTRKDLPPTHHWHSSVVIANTSDMLIAQCELTASEKRLFQSAGLLPHATLWPHESNISPGNVQESASTQTEPAVASTALNLSDVADRPRRHLLALVQLVQQGKLDATDTDLLLKTARQLSKAHAARRSAAKPVSKEAPKR